MPVVTSEKLAEEFADQDLERSYLAALAARPDLHRTHQLVDRMFYYEPNTFRRTVAGEPPPLGSEWCPSPAPDQHAQEIRDLYHRRRLHQEMIAAALALHEDKKPLDVLAALEMDLAKVRQEIAGGRGPILQWAVPVAAQLVEVVRERHEAFLETGKAVTGVLTGLVELDDRLNGLNAGLHILAGMPGVGKTTAAWQFAGSAARQGVPVLYISYENAPQNLLAKVLCPTASCTTMDMERGHVSPERIAEAAEKMHDRLKMIALLEGNGDLDVVQIGRLAREVMATHQAPRCLVVVDYLQKMAHGKQMQFQEIRHNVTAITGDLRELSRSLSSPVLAISSQNRAGYGSKAMDSLKEAGELEYGADTVLILTKDDRSEDPPTPPAVAVDLTISKNRYGPSDHTIKLIFRPDRATILERSRR